MPAAEYRRRDDTSALLVSWCWPRHRAARRLRTQGSVRSPAIVASDIGVDKERLPPAREPARHQYLEQSITMCQRRLWLFASQDRKLLAKAHFSDDQRRRRPKEPCDYQEHPPRQPAHPHSRKGRCARKITDRKSRGYNFCGLQARRYRRVRCPRSTRPLDSSPVCYIVYIL